MILLKASRYFSTSTHIHPYLQHNLKANKLFPLRDLQLKALQTSKNHRNMFLNQSDGSGKTLAYLVPILNEAISSKVQKRQPSKAIIVTLNKQLSMQIYQQIRKLDPKKVLNVNRSGSITHYSSVIDEMCKPSKQQDHDLIVDLMNKNVTDSVIWHQTDILVTTPKLFYRIMEAKREQKVQINPKFLVLDEADVILQHNELLNYVNKGLQNIQISSAKNSSFSNYILVSPKKNILDQFKKRDCKLPKWQEFSSFQSQNSNNIIQSVKTSFVEITKYQKQDILNQKIGHVIKIISHSQNKRFVVYCQKASVEPLKSAVSQLPNIIPSQIYASLSTQKRMLALFNFVQGKSNLLITTDVTSRGFNFGKEVDAIISFDVGDRQEEENRLSRSNKIGGQYIILGSNKQKNEVQHILNYSNKDRKE